MLVAEDAVLSVDSPKQIVLFVIGDSVGSANFSLNGYEKETNPYTKAFNVISFREFYSCGVITAIAVPCMLTTSYQRDLRRTETFHCMSIISLILPKV